MSFIAIVEDDQDQRENLVDALVRRGYEVQAFANRNAAYAALSSQPPTLLVSDIILEGEFDGGFALCEDLLKCHPELSVIFMTERVEEVDQVTGLRMGAIDYLPKPFSMPVMLAKIATHFKRLETKPAQTSDETLTAGPLIIREAFNEVLWQNQVLHLTLTELRILTRLVQAHGRILSKEQLSGETRQVMVEANTINTHIKNLRKKFRQVDAEFDAIKSEYGVGYRWAL